MGPMQMGPLAGTVYCQQGDTGPSHLMLIISYTDDGTSRVAHSSTVCAIPSQDAILHEGR